MRSALRRSLPQKRGERNHKVFALVRELRAIMPDVEPEALWPYVREWHAQALAVIGTPEFSVSWADFLTGWNRARVLVGSTLASVKARALGDPTAMGLGNANADLVAAAFRAASEAHNGGTFHLGFEKLAEITGLSWPTARRWADKLVDAGYLSVVERGTRGSKPTGKATTWRWIGSNSSTSEQP
jgi:DNA-binding transcriptional ArsR family regulator